jgi:hypothetical protein
MKGWFIMKMELEIKCSSCGSPDVVYDENEAGKKVFICKNPECDDFNCFFEFSDVVLSMGKENITEGMTKTIEFENEDGKWVETIENGMIKKSVRVK